MKRIAALLAGLALLQPVAASAQSGPAIPYTFSSQSGYVPASQLDANFNYVLNYHVGTLAALRALQSTAAAVVVRDSYKTPGDAPPLQYMPSSLPCSLNGGTGDNGAQVPSADGKCWIANFPNGQADLREWGAQSSSSGAYDSGPAIRAAYAWSAASGTPVVVPHGQFWLNSPDPSNLAAIVVNPGGGVSNGFPMPSGQFIGLNSPNHPDNPNTGTTSWFTLGAGLNLPMVFFRKAAAPVLWTDLFLSGNRGGQTGCKQPGAGVPVNCPGGKLYVVVTEDDGSPLFGDSSIRFERTIIRDGYDGDLYQGAGRGGLWLRDVWLQYSGQASAAASEYAGLFNGYDAVLDNVAVGSNAGNGVLFNEGSQYQITNGAIFLNGTSGVGAGMVVNGNAVNYLTVEGTNIQANQCNGVKVVSATPEAGQNGGGHTYTNVVFDGNSAVGAGTCSDFLSQGSVVEALVNATFIGNSVSGNFPKYNIETSGASGTNLIKVTNVPCVVNTSGSIVAPNTSGFTNDPNSVWVVNGGKCAGNTEGTWTPQLSTDGSAGTPAYAIDIGTWSRNANEITAHFVVQTSNWTGSPSGNLVITGLPFAASANPSEAWACTVIPFFGWSGASNGSHGVSYTDLSAFVGTGSQMVYFYDTSSGQPAIPSPLADWTLGGLKLIGTCVYRTDS